MKTRSDPRRLVLDLLLSKGDFPTRLFGDAARRASLSGRDRALARQLLGGVLRQRRALDSLWRPFVRRKRLDPPVMAALRMALFQRFYLDQVPSYAAIGATLESCKPVLGKATGFANAVLRAVDQAVVAEIPGCAPAPDALVAGARTIRFDRPLLPDPEEDPRAYWGRALSFPDTLVRRWFEALGAEGALERMRALQSVPPLALRVNSLRGSADETRQALAAAGHAVAAGPLPTSLVLPERSGDVLQLPGYPEGKWAVQDLSSQQVAALAHAKPGERVLDLCAAPGGKSFAVFEGSGGKAEVLACDVDQARLRIMERERQRLGHSLRCLVVGSSGAGLPQEQSWDLVILDVPCSNTGVLGRRPEARWRFGEESLRGLLEQQQRIRETAARLASSHTRFLWSTCSLEPEENLLAAEDLARRAGRRVAEARQFEPSALQSGAFAALILP